MFTEPATTSAPPPLEISKDRRSIVGFTALGVVASSSAVLPSSVRLSPSALPRAQKSPSALESSAAFRSASCASSRMQMSIDCGALVMTASSF